MNEVVITLQDAARIAAINCAIPGWSDNKQYAFFKWVLAEKPDAVDFLILGVYHGRDIAYLLDVAARYHPSREIRVVGVDKFNAEPCADWPEEKMTLSWERAGFGFPPSLDRASENLARYSAAARTKTILIKREDHAFLAETKMLFDVVYVDTSHDYKSVKRVMGLLPNVCREETLIAGDDFTDENNWGVKSAVGDSFASHGVFANWIWFSNRSELKPLWIMLGPEVDLDAVNAAVEKHWPTQPNGWKGDLYYSGRDGLFSGEPYWILGGMTPVFSGYVLQRLQELGEDVSKLILKKEQ
jgi:hypothetical protein